MNGRLIAGGTLGIILLFACNQAHAVITAKTPLRAIEGSATYILVGRVVKHFPDRPAMLVTVTEDIKGKAPFRKMPINCKVADEKAFKDHKIEPLLKRFGPDIDIIFFLKPQDKSYITFAFTNGTWFQLLGTQVGKDEAVFALTSAEPYFRKTFKGTTEELRKLLKDYAAKKGKLPPLDDKAEPGFGPEYTPKKAALPARLPSLGWLVAPVSYGGGPLFGVIPTIGIGAPLAILALLFPSIFGGVFVLFRQWLAFITLISINSTLLILHAIFAESLPRGSWWATPAALWFSMTVCTFACAFWAWRRQLDALSDGDQDASARTELAVLSFMAGSCVVTTIVMWFVAAPVRWSDVGWALTVVMTVGILAGTLYRAWRACQKPTAFGSLPLATEGVILGAMLLGHVVFVPAIFVGNISTTGRAEGSEQSGDLSAKVAPIKQRWVYTAPENIFGMFASPPLVDDDAVYAAYSDAFQRATMVRIDRQTGLPKWTYAKTYFRQMISTPCLHYGKLYFGEGFHDDLNCQVFCLNAETGDEVWRFKTAGQTESSPAVTGGKVYIGAGNDGVYCLDAKTGAKVWHYPHDDAGVVTRAAYKARIQRFGGGMVLVGKRLYCGTGEDRNAKDDKGETAVFCFDADTGKVLWKTPAPFPVWSTPVVRDGLIYVTSGNGDVFTDAPAPTQPGGALQCLDLQSGKERWTIRLPNGVIEAPAVDAHRIYFGCRDMHVYCVNRSDGKQRWRYFLESPIVGTPALDSGPGHDRTLSVFVVTTAGKVCCMTPQKGDIVWSFDLTAQQAAVSTAPQLVVTRTPEGYTRQLYFAGGLGGGPLNVLENRPVLYCLEDKVTVE